MCKNFYLNGPDLNVKAASPFLYMYCFFHVNTKHRTEQFRHDIARLKVKKLGKIKMVLPQPPCPPSM